MPKYRYIFIASMVVGCSSASRKKPATDPTSPAPSTTSTGSGTTGGTSSGSVNGALPTQLLPAGHAFYVDVSALDVHPQSATYLASIGLSQTLHPNFGSTYNGQPLGYPYSVVSSGQATVPIHFVAHPDVGGYTEPPYPKLSVPGPLPIPSDALPLGGLSGTLDRTIIVYDQSAKVLYEMYRCFPNADGSWDLIEAAKFDLSGSTVIATGSVAAAGTPKLGSLVRYDEAVSSGVISHAIAMAVSKSQAGFIPPAVRSAGSGNHDPSLPPMGLRLRLKASFDISTFPKEVQVILTAAKKYGFIVDDNGISGYVTGTYDSNWNNTDLATLRNVKISDLEVVYTGDITPGI